ncbi:MAG TPA: YibE/F family protein [Clostridia bacterium]|nr:YibE/F family protein [Clostridia bacterium]
MNKKRIFIVFILIILTMTLGFAESIPENTGMNNENIENNEQAYEISYERAKVLEVIDFAAPDEFGEGFQEVTLKITSGEYAGEVFLIENHLPKNLAYRIEVAPGDNIIIAIDEIGNEKQIYISDYYRNNVLIILVFVFLGLLIIIGKYKGFKSVITISLTMFLIFKVLIPGILNGYNSLALSISISSVITILTIVIVSGFNKKSLAAIIGTVSGVVIAGGISIIVGNTIEITGMMPDEAAMLQYLPNAISLNYKNLLFSGILLGALGAVMDVAMSIASSINEIYNANSAIESKTLFKAGMAVGHDIMGTMANTLILAYTGSSIPLLLILNASGESFTSIVNMDIVATEVVRSLAGSIGLIVTIPITAIISVIFLKSNASNK